MKGPRDNTPFKSTPDRPEPQGLLAALLQNLIAGLSVAQFKPVGRRQFIVTGQQAIALLVIAALMAFAYTLALWQGFAVLEYALESGWFKRQGTSCLLMSVAAYCISVLMRDPEGINSLAVIAISSMTLPLAVCVAITAGIVPLIPYAVGLHMSVPIVLLSYFLLLLWCLGTLTRAIRITYRFGGMRPALFSLLLIGAFLAPAISWHPAGESATTPDAIGNTGDETNGASSDN